jgi:hypothetical protein
MWESDFSATYTEFVLNATTIYNTPKLPVFVAQVDRPKPNVDTCRLPSSAFAIRLG